MGASGGVAEVKKVWLRGWRKLGVTEGEKQKKLCRKRMEGRMKHAGENRQKAVQKTKESKKVDLMDVRK